MFFDKSSQGDRPIGGEGGIIFIYEENKISFKIGLGRNSNTKEEVSTLWETMKLASDKHITMLHIYGDYKTVIDWETWKNNIRAPHLHNILKEIRAFEAVLFSHIWI